MIDKLLSNSEDDYGELYRPHVLETYKLCVDMADKISSRRQSANSFFLTINTTVVGFVSYLQFGAKAGTSMDFYWLISLAGIVLCYAWYRLILSYKGLNSAKFKVIHEIEKILPLSPYDAEWEVTGRGKDPSKHVPFTKVEMAVPWVFLVLHVVVLVVTLAEYLSVILK